jgi:hypothetical protein
MSPLLQLLSDEVASDPYAFYRHLRADDPLHFDESTQSYLVTPCALQDRQILMLAATCWARIVLRHIPRTCTPARSNPDSQGLCLVTQGQRAHRAPPLSIEGQWEDGQEVESLTIHLRPTERSGGADRSRRGGTRR